MTPRISSPSGKRQRSRNAPRPKSISPTSAGCWVSGPRRKPIRPATGSASRKEHPRPAAATDGRTFGGVVASAGSPRARERTCNAPSSSFSFSPALEYPPLLIVSDIDSIVLHTAFTATVPEVRVLTLDDLLDANKRRLLKWAFTDPERLRPGTTTEQTTAEAAARFGDLAQSLRTRGSEPAAVAHFLIRLLFCLFAEDTDLSPEQMLTELFQAGQRNPATLPEMLTELFRAMANGGRFGFEAVEWFNGGLFDTEDVLPLQADDVKTLAALARLDWSAIEPSIFGTLFERGLDPAKRSQLGAHYTDRGSIMRIVDPVVVEPLRDEWSGIKAEIAKHAEKATKTVEAATATHEKAKAAKALTAAKTAETKATNAAEKLYRNFLDRLAGYRVLDPDCGSENNNGQTTVFPWHPAANL
jgi:hypothetical protein